MIVAKQFLEKSYSLREVAQECPTDALRIEALTIADQWRRLSLTARYQDQIAVLHAAC